MNYMLHIPLLNPEIPTAITLKSLVPGKLPMYKYHLQTPVSPYTQPTLQEEEMPRQSI